MKPIGTTIGQWYTCQKCGQFVAPGHFCSGESVTFGIAVDPPEDDIEQKLQAIEDKLDRLEQQMRKTEAALDRLEIALSKISPT